MMGSVVVFSPNRFSLYTVCVTELLRRNGADVKAIVVRKLLDRKRFLTEFRRDGSRLLMKVWRKFILRKSAYRTSDHETIVDFMSKQNIHFAKVEDFREYYDIPVVYCRDLNDPIVIETLKRLGPDVVVFTGGGLIRKAVLENSGAGVLNCHMGVLPQYRGMDVVEWPILLGDFDQIGVTVHFMDRGIDTGDILAVTRIGIEHAEHSQQLRDRLQPIMCQQIANACLDYLDGRLERRTQKHEDGKQYFRMHPRLRKLAEMKLRKYHRN